MKVIFVRLLSQCVVGFRGAVLLTGIVWVFSSVQAARMPESRADATHVVVGEVIAVFEREEGDYTGYVVRLRVERVEKGEGVVVGDFFHAYCFQRGEVKGPVKPGAIGHDAVPKEGQRIKAFVQRDKGLWEGVYPDWFDVEGEGSSESR
jgi:hypothetical protein